MSAVNLVLKILQKYLATNHSTSSSPSSELGASVAEHFAKTIGPVQRQLSDYFCLFECAGYD